MWGHSKQEEEGLNSRNLVNFDVVVANPKDILDVGEKTMPLYWMHCKP